MDTQERARAQDRPGAEGDHEAGGGLRAHLLPPRPGGQSGRIHPGGQGTRLLPQEDGQEEAEVTTEQINSSCPHSFDRRLIEFECDLFVF